MYAPRLGGAGARLFQQPPKCLVGAATGFGTRLGIQLVGGGDQRIPNIGQGSGLLARDEAVAKSGAVRQLSS